SHTKTRAVVSCCGERFSARPVWPSACLRRLIPTPCAIIAVVEPGKGGGSSDLGELLSGLFCGRLCLQRDLVSGRRHALALSPPTPPAWRRTRSDRRTCARRR